MLRNVETRLGEIPTLVQFGGPGALGPLAGLGAGIRDLERDQALGRGTLSELERLALPAPATMLALLGKLWVSSFSIRPGTASGKALASTDTLVWSRQRAGGVWKPCSWASEGRAGLTPV